MPLLLNRNSLRSMFGKKITHLHTGLVQHFVAPDCRSASSSPFLVLCGILGHSSVHQSELRTEDLFTFDWMILTLCDYLY